MEEILMDGNKMDAREGLRLEKGVLGAERGE